MSVVLASGNYISIANTYDVKIVHHYITSGLLGKTAYALPGLQYFEQNHIIIFYSAVICWIAGNDTEAIRLLEQCQENEHAKSLMRLITKPKIKVLSQLDRGSWSCVFDAIKHDPKFKLTNIGFKEDDLPSHSSASIHECYSPQHPPDFYITKMLEWHLIPSDIQELPCPIFAQTADYDIHIQSIYPWLNALDELIIEHEWDSVVPLVNVPVVTYPKAYPLLAAALNIPLPEHTRDIDIFISGTVFHPYHPDKAAIINKVLEIDDINILIYDGFLETNQYLKLLSRSKICITYIRRPGMPTRGLEALAMGCAVLVQENSSLLLYLKDGEGVFTYNNENLEQKIRYILAHLDELQPAVVKASAFVRSEFETSKIASQYFRFLTYLAAKPRDSRKLVQREKLRHKRLIFMKGWLLKPDVYKELRIKACEELERLSLTAQAQAHHFIDAARELILEYSYSVHTDCMQSFNTAQSHTLKPLLETAFRYYKRGIEIFPSALVLRFNYIRTALIFGDDNEIYEALSVASETIEKPISFWQIDPMYDVFPWDYFSQLFNYREYFDTVIACLSGDDSKLSDLIKLIIASIHYHMSYFVSKLDNSTKAYELDSRFPFYTIRYANVLVEEGDYHDILLAADLYYELARTSMLMKEACVCLQNLSYNCLYAAKLAAILKNKYDTIDKSVVKVESGHRAGGFNNSSVPFRHISSVSQ